MEVSTWKVARLFQSILLEFDGVLLILYMEYFGSLVLPRLLKRKHQSLALLCLITKFKSIELVVWLIKLCLCFIDMWLSSSSSHINTQVGLHGPRNMACLRWTALLSRLRFHFATNHMRLIAKLAWQTELRKMLSRAIRRNPTEFEFKLRQSNFFLIPC